MDAAVVLAMVDGCATGLVVVAAVVVRVVAGAAAVVFASVGMSTFLLTADVAVTGCASAVRCAGRLDPLRKAVSPTATSTVAIADPISHRRPCPARCRCRVAFTPIHPSGELGLVYHIHIS